MSAGASTIPALGCDWSGRLSSTTLSPIADLAVSHLVLQNLPLLCPPRKMLVLGDSRAVLLQLNNEGQGMLFADVETELYRDAEDARWLILLLWVPSHSGMSGIMRADALASRAHC